MSTELQKAVAAYRTATQAGKKMLEGIFGKQAFVPKTATRLATFEACYAEFKKASFKDAYYKLLQKRTPAELSAIDKLVICAYTWQSAENWVPDFGNSDQIKYWPYFKYEKSAAGFGFSCSSFDLDYSHSGVGSRLCFPTSDMARYFCQTFIALYNEFLTVKK